MGLYQENINFCTDETRQPLAAKSSWRVLFSNIVSSTQQVAHQGGDGLEVGFSRHPRGAHVVFDDLEAGILQLFLQNLHRLAAPTVTAKGGSLLVLEFQLLGKLDPACDGGKDAVAHGGRSNGDGLRLEDFGHHLVLVGLGDVEHLDDGVGALAVEFLGDAVCDLGGAFPHGVVEHGHLVLLVGIGPLGVFLHDLHRVVAPNGAMRGGDDVDWEVEACYLLEFLRKDSGEGVEDVGVILHGLFPQQALVGLVVEEFLDGVVLAEGIVREEDVVTGHVGRHRVGPVQHPHLDEDEFLSVADFDAVAGLHHVEVPSALAVLSFKAFHALGGAVNRGFGNEVHECGERAAVVAFAVVGHNEVNLVQVDFLLQVLDEIEAVRCPDGVDKDVLFFLDEIGVLA